MADEGAGPLGEGQAGSQGPEVPPSDQSDAARVEQQEEDGRGRWSRLALTIILLLLLLLCAVTTVADVWVTTSKKTRTVVARNLECLQCHVELIPQFAMPTVHNPFEFKRCTTCHTPHGKQLVTKTTYTPAQRWERVRTLIEWLPLRLACEIGNTPKALVETTGKNSTTKVETKQDKEKDSHLTMPENELCWLCHGDVGPQRSLAFQHSPFEKGYCTGCHNPHASGYRGLLNMSERELCVMCHPIGDWAGKAQQHPPVEEGYCTACHHPHASDYKGILTQAQRELCFSCHPAVAMLAGKSVQHYPFLYDDCTGCHEPHGSDYTPLLIQYQPQLCYRCHPGIQNDFRLPSHHPVGSVQLNCGDCHDPHAADYQYLINARDNSFCYQCHTRQIKATYEPSAHKDILCIRCHTPHGSNYGPLLRRKNPPLCLECHGWIEHPNTHPYTPDYRDIHARKPLTCTSTCHNPHGTGRPFMVVGFNCPVDGQCLQCHYNVGITF